MVDPYNFGGFKQECRNLVVFHKVFKFEGRYHRPPILHSLISAIHILMYREIMKKIDKSVSLARIFLDLESKNSL